MRSTFKVLFYLKRDRQKANGMVPLFCRITVDGKEVRFGMKCDVNPKYRDVEAGKATGRTADAVKINAPIDKIPDRRALKVLLPFITFYNLLSPNVRTTVDVIIYWAKQIIK